MSNVNLLLDGVEAACIYASVTNELNDLRESLESDDFPKEETENCKKSIAICESILSKLSAADPSATYEYCE